MRARLEEGRGHDVSIPLPYSDLSNVRSTEHDKNGMVWRKLCLTLHVLCPNPAHLLRCFELFLIYPSDPFRSQIKSHNAICYFFLPAHRKHNVTHLSDCREDKPEFLDGAISP